MALYEGGLFAILAGMILVSAIVSIGLWVYMSLAFVAVGRKAKLRSPGLAWIPGVGPLIIAFQASKMHWWPWLLLAGYVIPVVGVIAVLAFYVFAIIWMWKMFEKIKKPGYWAILMLIPIVNLILIGIAAWGKK